MKDGSCQCYLFLMIWEDSVIHNNRLLLVFEGCRAAWLQYIHNFFLETVITFFKHFIGEADNMDWGTKPGRIRSHIHSPLHCSLVVVLLHSLVQTDLL